MSRKILPGEAKKQEQIQWRDWHAESKEITLGAARHALLGSQFGYGLDMHVEATHLPDYMYQDAPRDEVALLAMRANRLERAMTGDGEPAEKAHAAVVFKQILQYANPNDRAGKWAIDTVNKLVEVMKLKTQMRGAGRG